MSIKRADFLRNDFRLLSTRAEIFWETIPLASLPKKAQNKIIKTCSNDTDGDIHTVRIKKGEYVNCVWCVDEPELVRRVKCRKNIYERGYESFIVYFSKKEEDEGEAVAFSYCFMGYVVGVPLTECRDMEWKDVEALVKSMLGKAHNIIDKDRELNSNGLNELHKHRQEELAKAEEKWNGTGHD